VGGSGKRQRSGGGGGKSSLQAVATMVVAAPSISYDEVELLQTTGCGDTAEAKAVTRYSTDKFLSCRMEYLRQPPISARHELLNSGADSNSCIWTPHQRCHWTPDGNKRLDAIRAEQDRLWSYQPLKVDDGTRWKARVMTNKNKAALQHQQQAEDISVVMGRAVAILNKLSWTTLEKLTVQFLDAITRPIDSGGDGNGAAEDSRRPEQKKALSVDVIKSTMALVLDKASTEPHFAELYATFSARISTQHKMFKKILLALCQDEFAKSEKAICEIDLPQDCDPAEREMEILRVRKKTFGLMIFIGELYKMRMLKEHIMIHCLESLLTDQDEEDKLECFAKLLTTVGQRLEDEGGDDLSATMDEIWNTTYIMAGKIKYKGEGPGPKAPSTRIKFLLQDLVEERENGWVKRREEEKAKTLAQIHKDVAKEEKQTANASNRGGARNNQRGVHRSQSTGNASAGGGSGGGSSRNLKQQQKQQPPPDAPAEEGDGFVQVSKSKKASFRRSQSDSVAPKSSLQMALAAAGGSSKKKSPARSISPKETNMDGNSNAASSVPPIPEQSPLKEYLDPKECGDKAKKIMQEYFVGGDTDDAVLSIHELVGVGQPGDAERGAAVVEAAALMVMEMRESDVRKMLQVISRCLAENKIRNESLAKGLGDPLEFLRDIEIDAPKAASLLATVVADWIQQGALPFDFLLSAPEFFLKDGRPADFAGRVLAVRGGDPTDGEIDVVTKLMSEEEKKAHGSAREFLRTFS